MATKKQRSLRKKKQSAEAEENDVAGVSKMTESIHEKQKAIVGKRKYHHRLSIKGYIGLKEDEVHIKSGNVEQDEEVDRAVLWKKARKVKIDDEEADKDLKKIVKKIGEEKELCPQPKKNELKALQIQFTEAAPPENVPKRWRLLYKHAMTIMKETVVSVKIPCDRQVFGCDKKLCLLQEELLALLEFNMVGQSAISAYMMAVKSFNAQTGRTSTMPKVKNLLGTPKQPSGYECAYAVMRYMKEIIEDKDFSFHKKWMSKSRKCYEMDELDEVRNEALGFIEQYI
ncbi:hypothetical protein ACET3Z_004966 [Daucus carota]